MSILVKKIYIKRKDNKVNIFKSNKINKLMLIFNKNKLFIKVSKKDEQNFKVLFSIDKHKIKRTEIVF